MFLDDFFCLWFLSLESQNMLIVKDLFKLKAYLNFSDLTFSTQNSSVFLLNTDLIFLTHKTDIYFH